MRPLWRDLIQAVWAVDSLQCPHCHSALHPVETLTGPEAIEFFLRLHGLWEGLVNIPPPPDAPFDIDTVRGHPKCTTDGHLGRVQSAPLFGGEEPVFCRR